jgi:putative sigma-54 modulation protein
MQFQVTFRHMEATDALKEYAEKRMNRLKKYFSDPIACHVIMTTEKYNHRVDVKLQLKNGFQIAGHETTENMYSSVDMVAAKIERQVRRYKDKLRSHKPREVAPLPVFHSLIAEAPEPSEPTEPTPPSASISKREQIDAPAMTVDDAIMQLNLLHEQFYVFRSESSGEICVVYRREGGYGLIEAGPAASG